MGFTLNKSSTHNNLSIVDKANNYLKNHPDYFAGKSAPLADRILKPRTVAAAEMAAKMESTSATKIQQMFQEIFTDALHAVEVYSPDGKLINANPNALKLFGISELSEIVGLKLFEDPNLTDEVKKILRETGRASYECDFNFKALHERGVNTSKTGKIHLQVSINKLNHDRIGYVVQIEDITEITNTIAQLKESKLKYMNFVVNAQDPMFSLDDKYRFLYVNYACTKLFGDVSGLTSDDVIGHSLYEVFPREEADVRIEIARKVFETGISFQYELYITLNTGERKYISVSADPVKGDDGKVTSASFMVKDITERKKLEDSLKETNLKLEETNDHLSHLIAEKDKFFSILAHDLRAPFNSIIGFGELARTAIKDLFTNIHKLSLKASQDKNLVEILSQTEELQDYLKNLNATSEAALKKLDDLLVWGRLLNGQMKSVPKIIYISAAVEAAHVLCLGNAIKKKIELSNNIEKTLIARADNNMLAMILENLIINAIKFTQPGGAVKIYAVNLGEKIEIAVSDNGVGIEANVLARLFDENHIGSKRGTMNESGTGLGLINVKKMVELQGGAIWITTDVSHNTHGTTFHFTLPAEQD